MNFIVQSRSKRTKKFFEAILPSMIRQLNLTNSRKCLIVKTDRIDSQGVTLPFYDIDTYLVVVNSTKRLTDMGITLAHEMVHVRQMAKGKLKSVAKGNTWNGKLYTKKTKYLDQPWEQDAFAKQELVFRRAIND
jgi:Zn-dependent peptidase ImmA (M78 family)